MPNSFRTTQISIPEGFIDLGRGDPQLKLLPLDMLQRAAQMRLRQPDNSFLQYGPEQGDGFLRLALARFLAGDGSGSADPDRLFITAGISSGLDVLCSLFTRAGDTIFVEEPTYFLALQIFADHGLQVVSIPTDEAGIIVEAMEEQLKTRQPKFLYVIPAFQNPSGHTLAEDRRQRIVTLARQHDFLLLADEVYQYLHYSTQPPAAFGSYADLDHIVSLGSFSKILAPGLRLGWVQAGPEVLRRLTTCGLLTSGGGMNPFTSAIVRDVLESGGLERNIEHLVRAYAPRVAAMSAALRRHLPEAQFITPEGGYFFWVRLPGCDMPALRSRAKERQVDLRQGALFSSQGGMGDLMRLSISYYEAPDIQEGIRRLSDAFHEPG